MEELPVLEIRLKTIKVKVDNPRLMVWTPTAIELWNDKKFIEQRIEEQQGYIQLQSLRKFIGEIDGDRFKELVCFAQLIWQRFDSRLKELNSDIA